MIDPSRLPVLQWILFCMQLVTLVALVIYVWKTWEMAAATLAAARASADTLEEMRAARREASAPRPFIYFSSDYVHLAEIVVENTGHSTAAELTFSFDPPLRSSRDAISPTLFFDTPKYLPPGTCLKHAFDSWPAYFKSDLPLTYRVTLRYKRLEEDTYREEIQVLDAAGFKDYMRWSRKDIHDVATALEKQAESLERHARDERSSREQQEAAAGLFPQGVTLREAVATLLGLWHAFKAARDSKMVLDWFAPYLPAMRRACASALVTLELENRSLGLRSALQAVFNALHHHGWGVLGPQEPEQDLEAALMALEDLQPLSAAPEK